MRYPGRDCIHILAAISLLILTGCAVYHSHPLPSAPDLAQTPTLTIPVAKLDLPGLERRAPHMIPSNGLDVTAVMTLAVLNNPTLKASRLQAGVTRAQLLQAGLLPDPQFSAGFASSALDYGGALSLSQDIRSILTRGAAKSAARASAKQVNLNILWQEIQVAERARELFIQAQADAGLRRILRTKQKLLDGNYARDRAAMGRGDATAGTVAADMAQVAAADTSLRQLQTDINLVQHELNALLGLEPDAQLHLIGTAQMQPISKAELTQAMAVLPYRRADLLALQAGYQSQEETLRRAILAQFPALTAGVNLERDPVEGVNSFGPEISLTLPLFNRNRGQIAIARATRAVLREQYQAQLDSAAGQADQVWKANQIIAAQLRDADAEMPFLQQTAAAARQSFRRDNLDAALYLNTRSALLTKQAEAIRLRESLDIGRSALSTLLGFAFGST